MERVDKATRDAWRMDFSHNGPGLEPLMEGDDPLISISTASAKNIDAVDQEIYDALTESPGYKRKRFILTGPQVTAEEHGQLKAAFREVAQR